MNVKIDTKEKFTVITPLEQSLSANMTDKMEELLLAYIQKDIPHIVFKMTDVQKIDDSAAEKLALLQQQFYEHNCSFVICDLQLAVKNSLQSLDLLDVMNITPTESEAWDILQMEEIERELLKD